MNASWLKKFDSRFSITQLILGYYKVEGSIFQN